MKEILLVEEDPVYSKILSYVLENNGYHVECAAGSTQAIGMVESKQYDLVVTDILMPSASGLDLLTKIKNGTGGKDTKVIVLSLMSNEFYLAESLSRGADEYLRKPVTAKDLVQSVRRHLSAKAA
jgi:DNA-binding response OmpR family regulator